MGGGLGRRLVARVIDVWLLASLNLLFPEHNEMLGLYSVHIEDSILNLVPLNEHVLLLTFLTTVL